MDFEWILDAFWRPNWMIWGAKMLLKINQKINEILDAFLKDFQREITKNIPNNSEAVTRRWVPGILNLPIRHTYPDTPCSPRGGRRIEDASRRHTAAPLLLGWPRCDIKKIHV